MYKQKNKKPRNYEFDLIVIGGGAAGNVAANLAANMGKKVALVEAESLGGNFQNASCLPLLALRESARHFRNVRNSIHYGVHTGEATLHLGSAQAWRASLVDKHQSMLEVSKKSSSVHHFHGRAHFLDSYTISIGERRLTARRFLLTTGSRPAVPAIPGLVQSGYLTYQDISNLAQPPKSVVVIGGGHTGLEIAQLLRDYGSAVTILEKNSHLLKGEDQDLDTFVRARFRAEKIDVISGANIQLINRAEDHKTIRFLHDGAARSISAEEIFIATGNRPNVDLGLDNAKIRYGLSGVIVDDYLCTTRNHIYAAGDVNPRNQTAASAIYQARLAIYNMYHFRKRHLSTSYTPRVIYTYPEIASVGLTKQQIIDAKIPYQSARAMLDTVTRSTTHSEQAGFVKVYASAGGTLLGAVIIAPNASEIIHELALAVSRGLKADAVSDIVHAIPTWSEAIRVACDKIYCN